MSDLAPALDRLLFWGVVGIGVFVAVQLLTQAEGPLRRALAAVLSLLLVPFEALSEAATAAAGWLQGQLAQVFELPGGDVGYRWGGWRVIGAFYNAAIVVLNIYAEVLLLLLTLPLLGLHTKEVSLSASAAMLTALSILALSAFWGGMLAESIGLTALSPWRDRPRRERALLGTISVAVLSGALWMCWEIGFLRGLALAATGAANSSLGAIDPYAASGPAAATVVAADAAASGSSHAELISAQYAQRQLVLPIYVNALLVSLTALTIIFGKWSLTHAVAYTVGLLAFPLWLAARSCQLALEIVVSLLHKTRDELVPSFTTLANIAMGGFLESLTAVRDDLFDRRGREVVTAAQTSLREASEAVIAAASPQDGLFAVANGAADQSEPRP